MLVMIDNYDSFTYNIVQYFSELGADVKVFRNDEVSLKAIERLQPDQLVISPGPCSPTEAGISIAAIQYFAGKLPILGICLGHQCIAKAFGGDIILAKQVMHGKSSIIQHYKQGIFDDLPTPYNAIRYHSLVVDQQHLPDCLQVTAWTENEHGTMDEIMGIKHTVYDIEGVQYHPESILSEHGHALFNNFLKKSG